MSHFANFGLVNTVISAAGAVKQLSYAPDGRRFVAACGRGVAKVFDSATGRLLCTLDPRAGSVNSAVWLPCGRTIAVGTEHGHIVLYDALMGAELRRWTTGLPVLFMAFSPCGTRLLSGHTYAPVVRVWCPATARLVCEITDENNRPAMSAFFLPGSGGASAAVISASRAGRVSINSAVDGSLLRHFELGLGDVDSMALSPSGSHIVVQFFDYTAHVYSVADGSEVARLELGSDVVSVAWASDSVVMTGRGDQAVAFFDIARNTEPSRALLAGHGWVTIIAARPDGRQVVASCGSQRIYLFEEEQ